MADRNSTITQDRLKELLHYDEEAGVFTWLVSTNRYSVKGRVAGSIHPIKRYRTIMLKGRPYRAHRLAWFYVHGEWPAQEIDHINGDRDDNRISNLRAACRSANMQNKRVASRHNKCGFLGVSEKRGKFQAQIVVDKKCFHLGTFSTPEEAHEAYLAAKKIYHTKSPIFQAAP